MKADSAPQKEEEDVDDDVDDDDNDDDDDGDDGDDDTQYRYLMSTPHITYSTESCPTKRSRHFSIVRF